MKSLLIKTTIFLISIVPLSTVISCSNTIDEIPKFPYIKLNIKNKIGEVTQKTINEVIKNIDKDKLSESNISYLNRVFEGINTANFANFIIKTTNNEITLEAKDNYTFSFDAYEQETFLKSKVVIDLPIRLSSGNVEITDMQRAAELLLASGSSIYKKIQALNIVFEKVDELNLDNFTWEIKNMKPSEKGDDIFSIPTIILKANMGFTFGDSTSLKSCVKSADPKMT